ncbi:MAG TPA: DUF885 family protein, partial [Flavisolibacter sp.]|nr:DUF885 family protein [Flavisolibacter sp.]
MKPVIIFFLFLYYLYPKVTIAQTNKAQDNQELAALFSNYYEENLKLNPTSATVNGDNRYNHLLYIDFTDSYSAVLKDFYTRNLNALQQFKRPSLSDNDKVSYDIFKRNMELGLERLTLKDRFIPFNQFNGLPLSLAQWGSGTVVQPFKTVKDYEDWISRAQVFSAWTDSAILYFKRGMEQGIVLPKQLVVKMIPQVEAFVVDDPTKSVFYGPIKNLPATFSDTAKQRLIQSYQKLITETLVPSY